MSKGAEGSTVSSVGSGGLLLRVLRLSHCKVNELQRLWGISDVQSIPLLLPGQGFHLSITCGVDPVCKTQCTSGRNKMGSPVLSGGLLPHGPDASRGTTVSISK